MVANTRPIWLNAIEMNPMAPTPKVATATLSAALSGLIVWILNTYLHAGIPAEIASLIATIFAAVGGYIAPHSDPTPKQVEAIKKDIEDCKNES